MPHAMQPANLPTRKWEMHLLRARQPTVCQWLAQKMVMPEKAKGKSALLQKYQSRPLQNRPSPCATEPHTSKRCPLRTGSGRSIGDTPKDEACRGKLAKADLLKNNGGWPQGGHLHTKAPAKKGDAVARTRAQWRFSGVGNTVPVAQRRRKGLSCQTKTGFEKQKEWG